LQSYADHLGYPKVKLVAIENLGLSHHGRLKYTILNTDTNIEKSIVVTHFIRSNLHKDKMLVPWSNSKNGSQSTSTISAGAMYKAFKYLRSIGLRTPLIVSVVDKALLITE
jgi:hypothetical protein